MEPIRPSKTRTRRILTRTAAILLLSVSALLLAGCITFNSVGNHTWYNEQRDILTIDYRNGLITDEEYVLRLRQIVAETEAYQARRDSYADRAKRNRRRHRVRPSVRFR